MKTEDIKKMAQAWKQVQEACKTKKESMDPVDQKALKGKFKDRDDKDINNDGKVNSSDEYLHNRRKAVSASIKSKKKGEEAEVQSSEATVNELSKATLGSYVKKASYDAASKAAEYGHDGSGKNFSKSMDRLRNIKKATDRLTKEEVEELDELSKKTLGSYVKKADKQQNPDLNKVRAARDSGGFKAAEKEMGNQIHKAKNRTKGVYQAIQKYSMKNEEVEELDELKKSTLSSYIKKASGNMAGKTAVQVAKVSSSNGKADPDLKRGLVNRMKGIGRAADKLAKESDDKDADDKMKKKSMKEATATHNPGVASPAGEGLSPSAKDQLAKKTAAPSDAFDSNTINKKTFDAIRSSGKKAAMRSNDNSQGDKNIVK